MKVVKYCNMLLRETETSVFRAVQVSAGQGLEQPDLIRPVLNKVVRLDDLWRSSPFAVMQH